jgi:hypothetical protein
MKLCFDIKEMRPGCVLLAAAMGGDTELAKQFHSETWLLAPTPDLKVYNITEEQFKALLKKVNKIA